MTHAELLRLVVENEEWVVEYTDYPERHPDALGERIDRRFALVQACDGDVLAVKPGCEADAYYQAAHEIAEARYGFRHCEEMWIEQCNILARFCSRIAFEAARERSANAVAPEKEGNVDNQHPAEAHGQHAEG